MKALLFKVPTIDDRSFRVQEDRAAYFYGRLHFHPERQLTLIREGAGTQIIGDKMDRFRPYDVLLLGTNLPHVFRSDPAYYAPETPLRSVSFSLFFDLDRLPIFSLPETAHLSHLLQESRHGVRLRHNGPTPMTTLLENLPSLRPFQQLVGLMQVLDEIATHPDREVLSTTAYEYPRRPEDHQRLDQVFSFIMQHYTTPISLENVADVAHLSPTAFCRFFKLHTRKTFSHLLSEIRIEHACRLLHHSSQPISQIALDCGFANLSNFNRQFKALTGNTPGEYARAIRL